MFSHKEISLQKSDIKKMIFPSTIKEKLKELSIEDEYGGNSLSNASKAARPFSSIINLILGQADRLLTEENQHLEYIMNKTGDSHFTELGQIQNNIKILDKQVSQVSRVEDAYIVNINELEDLLTTAFMIGHSTASHDNRVLLERHVENGIKSKVTTPKIAGEKSGKRSAPVSELITQMIDHVNLIKDYKVRQVDLKLAIFDIFKKYSTTQEATSILALSAYHSRYPSEKSIEKKLSCNNKTPQDKKVMMRHELKKYLSREFTTKSISSFLKNASV